MSAGKEKSPSRLCRSPSRRALTVSSRGFTLLEVLVVIAILGIIAAFALPNAINFVKAYRLHSAASSVASQLNVARFRATSQYTPYRVSFRISEGLFSMDRLTSTYTSPVSEVVLNLPTGISFLSSCPVSVRPGTVASSFSGISTAIYFNTRGLPVDASGSPTNNNVIYFQNDVGLFDAVTVSLGGRVTVWGYAPTTNVWVAR